MTTAVGRMFRSCWHGYWGACLALILAAPARAEDKAVEPLARYVPAADLAILLEHDGFDARPEAWKGTAAYQMLNKTSLGTMFEEIATQLVDRALQSAPGAPLSAKDAVSLLEHVAHQGIVIGYCGTFGPGERQAKASVIVIRGAAKNEIFQRLIGKIPPLNEPAAKRVEGQGDRTVLAVPNTPLRWWYEKDDAVFSFVPPGANDPVVEVLEGKSKSALENPAYVALTKPEAGKIPLGRSFINVEAIPSLPPQAAQLGLDGVKRFESRWEIQGKGLVTTLGVHAPRPRKKLLALFDQPAIGDGASLNLPKGVVDYTLLSVDPIRLGDAILALAKESNPNASEPIAQIAQRFRARTGLSLRDDLLSKIGPRMAIVAPPGGGAGSLFGMWFNPPDFGLLAEVKDAKTFEVTLDRLIEAVNRELRAAGSLVPPQRGQPRKPGTEFAEFRRLKTPARGYVLAIPPSVLPTPAGLRPTIILDSERGVVVFAGSPKAARQVLPSLVLQEGKSDPGRDRNTVFEAQSDPSGILPELLTNIPSLVQFIGFSAAQPGAVPPGAVRRPAGPPFRLALDPDEIPDVDDLRQYLFPSKVTLIVDEGSIRLSTYQAFPLPSPQFNGAAEMPVLISMLLPAVQAAREAARRAQCVNNLKQIGLALHNFHSTENHFPAAAITDDNGKQLLSWRVAILPFIDQGPLYNRFKLDEPWDSPHNIALLKEMPTVYACPSKPPGNEPGMTTYRAFSGAGALFDPAGPIGLVSVTDGTSNTVAVVESRKAVPWTKPDELTFGNNQDIPPNDLLGAGSSHPGGFNALFADGSVHFLKSSIGAEVLKALITRAGGEVVPNTAF